MLYGFIVKSMHTISKEINMPMLGYLFTFYLISTSLKFLLSDNSKILTSITKYDVIK